MNILYQSNKKGLILMTLAQFLALGLAGGSMAHIYFDSVGASTHYQNGLPVRYISRIGTLTTWINLRTGRVIRIPIGQIQAVTIP